MVITQGVDKWHSWLRIENPTHRVLEYLRRSVKPLYRVYDDKERVWYLHQQFAEGLQAITGSAEQDAYTLLHLHPTAPPAIIKAAWRELAKMHHPDKGGDIEQFKRIKQAYDSLIKE